MISRYPDDQSKVSGRVNGLEVDSEVDSGVFVRGKEKGYPRPTRTVFSSYDTTRPRNIYEPDSGL